MTTVAPTANPSAAAASTAGAAKPGAKSIAGDFDRFLSLPLYDVLAAAGELLATDPAARAAAAAGWQVEPLGLTLIRGLHDPVCIHRVLLCPAQDCDTDPVCGMRISPGPATPSEVVNGRPLWFCSPTCLERLRSAPERYLGEE